jgi:two-component system OmpR family response regulator
MRVLLIEDDQKLANIVQQVLEGEHYAVDVAFDGDSGLELALRGIHDLVVIDWMLPGRDGPSICRAIRAARMPQAILMLTARSQIEDRVAGLDSGADDYLAKPFSFDELLARLRALTRRFNPSQVDSLELRVGKLVLDLQTHSARRGEKSMELTKTEWDLMEFLMRHPDQVLTRQQILDYVWSYTNEVQPSMVEVYISYLRRKIDLPGETNPIETVRGIGYRLDARHA